MITSNQNCTRGADEEFLNFQILRPAVEVITAGNQIMVSVFRVKPSIVQSIQQFIIKPMDVAHYEEFRHNYHLYKLFYRANEISDILEIFIEISFGHYILPFLLLD